ncbi:MAG: hypothetical protein P8L43_04070 [Candidatus Marinimicrobia bacterium]|nr:hypothetical protein [Candidatus Neomarinimicrobiota bacterium]
MTLEQIKKILYIFYKNKMGLRFSVFFGGLLGMVILVFSDSLYESSFSAYPFAKSDDIQNEISNIAATYGFMDKEASSFYLPDLIYSEKVLKNIVLKERDELGGETLVSHWKMDTNLIIKSKYWIQTVFTDQRNTSNFNSYVTKYAVKKLRESIKIIEEYSGLIIVKIQLNDPAASFNVSNEIFEEMNIIYNLNNQRDATNAIRYLEKRLKLILLDVESSEQNLREFLEINRSLDSPDLRITEKRLQNNLSRTYLAYNTLFQKLELKLLDKEKSEFFLVQVDPPTLPSHPYTPNRIQVMLLSIFFISICSLSYTIIKNIDSNSINW